MQDSSKRIPIPWSDRWRVIRQRTLPLLCFVCSAVACAILWRYQTVWSPVMLAEIHVQSHELASPVDGELLTMDNLSDGHWSLFAAVNKGDVAARVKTGSEPSDVVDVRAPMSGQIVAVYATPGEMVGSGEPILKIVAQQADYIVGYVPDPWRDVVQAGASVAVRHRENGAKWLTSVVESVGPSVEAVPANQLRDPTIPQWGVPVHVRLPEALAHKPGSLVEVSFSQSHSAR